MRSLWNGPLVPDIKERQPPLSGAGPVPVPHRVSRARQVHLLRDTRRRDGEDRGGHHPARRLDGPGATKVHLADEVEKVRQGSIQAELWLRRLGKAYVDGFYAHDNYRRENRGLEEKLAGLVVPEVDATREARKLLEELPNLWEEADLKERRKIMVTMLDAVYVDTVEEKSVVALRPKPAFQALFHIATAREGSGVVLYNENPPHYFSSPEDCDLWLWWRLGRVELAAHHI